MRTLLRSIGRFCDQASGPWLPAIFILAAGPVLTFLILAVPPGEVPDEVAHLLRADSLRHGYLVGFRDGRLDFQGDPAPDVAVRANRALLAAGSMFDPNLPLQDKIVTAARLHEALQVRWAKGLENVSVPNTGVYPPIFYIPSAVTLQIAKSLKSRPHQAVLLARAANAIVFVVIGAAAIGCAQRGRMILFALYSLPISLALGASVNQDGLILVATGLAAALLTRGERTAWWWASVVLGLTAMAKPHLSLLALVLPAAHPGCSDRPVREMAHGVATATLPALLWVLGTSAFIAVPFIRGPAQPAGPLWAGPSNTLFATNSPMEQLRILLDDPSRLISLPIHTLSARGEWLWREAIGVLGKLDVVLPQDLYIRWEYALAGAVIAGFLAARSERPSVTLPVALVAFGSGLLSVWAIFILQYISWTRVGEPVIDGVQGRYFVPVAAFVLPLLTVPGFQHSLASRLGMVLGLPAVFLSLAGLSYLVPVILAAYYIR